MRAETEQDGSAITAMSTELTFPRVHRIRLDYVPREDRIAAHLTMIGGDGRVAWLSRRLVGGACQHMDQTLKRSHPASEGEPAHDTVMALEHIGMRAEVAAQQAEATPDAAGGADEVDEPTVWDHYLVTEIHLEQQDSALILAFSGHSLAATPAADLPTGPIAALALTRAHAHEILRLLTLQAEQADWRLQPAIGWLDSPHAASRSGSDTH